MQRTQPRMPWHRRALVASLTVALAAASGSVAAQTQSPALPAHTGPPSVPLDSAAARLASKPQSRASAMPSAGGYAARATLTPSPASADGRYRVDAALRVAPAVQSADGRYRVKAAAASCDPDDDGLFANGFESP